MMSAAATQEPLLKIRGVETFYGNIQALRGVDIDVHDGEIVTLIGTNGAGAARSISLEPTFPKCRRTRSPVFASPSRRKAAGFSGA
jgi:ABC-type branched-subunit amino acid transport system ATPase component